MTDTTTESTDRPTRPATVDRAFWAAIVWAVMSVLTAVVLLRHRSYVTDAIVRNADTAKAKERIDTPEKLDKVVSSQMTGGVISAIIIGLMVVLLAYAFGRKAKNWARWVLAVLAVVPFFSILGIGILLHLVTAAQSDPPADYRILQALAGVASVVMLVYLFMPATRAYFAAFRPNRIGASGRPGGLFGGVFGNARHQVDESRRLRDESRASRRSARTGPDVEAAADVEAVSSGGRDSGARATSGKRKNKADSADGPGEAASQSRVPETDPDPSVSASRPRPAKPKRSTSSSPQGRPQG